MEANKNERLNQLRNKPNLTAQEQAELDKLEQAEDKNVPQDK